ncbi:MAG: hypothetical protein ACRC4W_00750 [Treponemataceae bacterium]
MGNEKKSLLTFEQKALERTRKNIGHLTEDEAKAMMQKLGGEVGIGVESSEKKEIPTTAKIINRKEKKTQEGEKKSPASGQKQGVKSASSTQKIRIPILSVQQRSAFLKLYVQNKYRIISVFDFFLYKISSSDSSESASKYFTHTMLRNYLSHVENFSFSIMKIIDLLPAPIQLRIEKDAIIYMKILRVVKHANLKALNDELKIIQKYNGKVSISALSTFIKLMYKYLIKLLYLSEANMILALESACAEFEKHVPFASKDLKRFTKDAQKAWRLVYHEVIKGLYPLLMRFSSTECVSYNTFFASHTGKILNFLEVTRFELIIPEKTSLSQTSLDLKESFSETQPSAVEKPENNNASTDKQDDREKPQDSEAEEKQQLRDELRAKSFAFANRMFPEAGWENLDNFPDLYPYFQDLFEMPEGFNLIDNFNPMQLIPILVHILENLFSGTHKIDFFLPDSSVIDTDDFEKSIQDWYLFRVTLLEDTYYPLLIDYVNNIYSDKEFYKSPYGRKKLVTILWYQQTHFLPYAKFELNYMENETKKQLSQIFYQQVSSLTSVFTQLSANIDTALQKSKGKPEGRVEGVLNPWTTYTFALQTSTSRRLNVLLGGKNSNALTNANLIKAITCYLQILHWWINDIQSPAYATALDLPYRRDQLNDPVFSVPLRTDVKEIFVNHIKNLVKENTQ